MNVSSVGFNQVYKAQSFKGSENEKEVNEQISPDTAIIKESIDKNTAALQAIAEQVKINSYTLYAVEKSKSGSNGLHEDSYGKTNGPVSFINYVNDNWTKARY